MRSLIRNIGLNILGLIKRPTTGIHILNGHYISKEDKDGEIFFDLLKILKKKVEFVNIEIATQLIYERKNINDKLIAFTFDDGFEECYTKIAPVLKDFNVNAAFFLNPNFINGDPEYRKSFLKSKLFLKKYKTSMSWEMIMDLNKEGFIIGSHTMDHERLNINDINILKYQICESKSVIEKAIKGKCEYFAYPYGGENDFSEKAKEIALENYKYLFSGCYQEKYLSYDNCVINRRHFEGDWSPLHMNYFLSIRKNY